MNKIYKYSYVILCSLIALFFNSCSDEVEYVPASPIVEGGQAYITSDVTSYSFTPDKELAFTVKVMRASESMSTVHLTSNNDAFEVPSTVEFESGEMSKEIKVTFSCAIGSTEEVTISIPDEEAYMYGSNSVSVSVFVDYTWLSVGNVLFYAGWSGNVETEVSIEKAKETEGLFRLVSPYYYSETAGGATGVTLEEGHHIQFLLNESDGTPIGFPTTVQSMGESAEGDGNYYFAYTPDANNCSFTNKGNTYSINGLIAYDGEGEITLGWYETITFVWNEGYLW